MSKSKISYWPRKIYIYWDDTANIYSVTQYNLLGTKYPRNADWRLP